MSGWIPIATAPRDGTPVDVWCSFMEKDGTTNISRDVRFTEVWWEPDDNAWRSDDGVYLYETPPFPLSELQDGCVTMIVSHWMPTPKPPEASA